ncbi:MAG TPA: amidohydrolase family protein [Myxococcaceae bacterium]|nr:amidohydrolase family protein [Myxococcaceae bacterium]
MGTVLRGGTVVELEPAAVEVVDLRVEHGHITARGQDLPAQLGDEVIDVRGKVVMPGLVCGHHHLYRTLARGMPLAAAAAQTHWERTEGTLWKLDAALDLDAVQTAATAAGLEALAFGTTTVLDHHASPKAVRGSLLRVARGLNDVGLRGALCYEVSDRHGAVVREEALEETVGFQKKAKGRFRGMVGAHASCTLSPDALEGLREAVNATGTGVHLHLAEDPSDERISIERYGAPPVTRLAEAGLLSPKALLAHAVHLSWPELSQVLASGAWLVHNPRSNMETQVGYAPAGKFGARALLGTDGLHADMWTEAQLASLRALDAGQPIDVVRYLANGHRLASQLFEERIGPMREGAVADLLVLDYRPPTPLTAETLAAHLTAGMGPRGVEAVMVDGLWRMWGRRPLSVNPDQVSEQTREVARAVWARAAAG